MTSHHTPGTSTASDKAPSSTVDCSVWWCARPAGHDGDADQLHGRAIGQEVEAAGSTVRVSPEQLSNQPASDVLCIVVGNGPTQVMRLDPTYAARLAQSIDTTEAVPADHVDGTQPSLIVWLVVDIGRSEPVMLDSTTAHRIARRLGRAASVLTEQDGWHIPPHDRRWRDLPASRDARAPDNRRMS